MTNEELSPKEKMVALWREKHPPEIPILEGREHVRNRPAMYIGDTKSGGLHHLFIDILNNAIDEVLAGRATDIHVILHEDSSVSIQAEYLSRHPLKKTCVD